MRIVSARPLVLGTAWRNLTFVVVSTDEGIEGVGEVRMVNNTQALLGYLEEAIPNHVLGADPFATESLVQRMWHGDYGRPARRGPPLRLRRRRQEAVRRALDEAGVRVSRGPGLDFRDPWGNHVQVVDYREIQFVKAPEVLRALGLEGVEKTERALAELRAKGIPIGDAGD